MKICILTPRFPFPENGGDVLRINNIARYLKGKGNELVLISFCEKNIKLKKEFFEFYDTIYMVKRSRTESFFMSLVFALTGKPIQCGYYFSFRFLKTLKLLIKHEIPNIFISHLSRMTPYLIHTNNQKCSIIEMTDALSKTYELSSKAKGNFIKKCIYGVERRLIRNYEKYIVESFPKVVLVSRNDVEYLKRQDIRNKNSLVVHTNGVDCLSSIPTKYNSKKICFIGNMRTLQNQDAVLHFVKDIFPVIKKSVPDVVFTIIGAQPSEQILSLADGKNIIVTGFVDDIQTAISDCCLNVAPVRIAAGIQNKVLVAMGCGVPVVMSSLIAGAIPELIDGENCYIKDDDDKFAEECITLLSDENVRSTISKKGYETVKNNYSWNEKLEGYEIL